MTYNEAVDVLLRQKIPGALYLSEPVVVAVATRLASLESDLARLREVVRWSRYAVDHLDHSDAEIGTWTNPLRHALDALDTGGPMPHSAALDRGGKDGE